MLFILHYQVVLPSLGHRREHRLCRGCASNTQRGERQLPVRECALLVASPGVPVLVVILFGASVVVCTRVTHAILSCPPLVSSQLSVFLYFISMLVTGSRCIYVLTYILTKKF